MVLAYDFGKMDGAGYTPRFWPAAGQRWALEYGLELSLWGRSSFTSFRPYYWSFDTVHFQV